MPGGFVQDVRILERMPEERNEHPRIRVGRRHREMWGSPRCHNPLVIRPNGTPSAGGSP